MDPEHLMSNDERMRLFQAKATSGESIFRQMMGDMEGCIEDLEYALERKPDWPQAILAVASVENQLSHHGRGAMLIQRLLTLPDLDGFLWEFVDRKGEVLIEEGLYDEGVEYYEAAVRRFPGREGLYERAIEASREAPALEADNQRLVNGLGFSLNQAGHSEEAERTLSRATEVDFTDPLSRGNLEICREAKEQSV